MKKILTVVGTRPNFIKITQFKKAASHFSDIDLKIVHTGQHYDENLAEIFFKQFDLTPDYFLEIEQSGVEQQIDEIKFKLKNLIQTIYYPDLVIVVGDVNSTRAAAETIHELNIKLAHVESGLRSFDNTMPEEFNRVITDKLSDYHFITEESGVKNLLNEGQDKNNLFFVGNTMIDTLMAFEEKINSNNILNKLNIEEEKFVLLTMHRPANVDTKDGLMRAFQLIKLISSTYKLIFPVHPRTLNRLKEFNLLDEMQKIENVIITEPLNYFDFQKLITACKFIITDSGGIQEEVTFRNKPCLTIRSNTERPSTIEIGTNTLVGWDFNLIAGIISEIESNTYKKGKIPPLWDGKSTERIFQILADLS